MKHWLRWGVAALAAIALQGAPACALSTLEFSVVPVHGGKKTGPQGRVFAGSEPVMTLGGRGAQSVADAVEIARRLNGLAEAGLRPEEISIRRERRARIILARGQPIVEVDLVVARAHQTDPSALARTWADNLAAHFGRPYLSANPLVVPVGESRATPVRGSVVGSLRARAEAPCVSAGFDAAKKLVSVFGEYPGQTEVVIADDRSVLRLPVRAARYAAHVSNFLRASVTGSSPSRDAIYRAARAAVAADMTLEPGAWASISPRLQNTPSLPLGASKSVPVHVSAAGEDYLPYQSQTMVTVSNEAVTQEPPDVLMVSNSPERLLTHGLWFEGSLKDFQSARLLYHHVNSTGVHSDLVIELWNVGDQESRVHVISGTGGPSRDEAWAGHRATGEFLANRASGVGWIVPLPPRTAVPVISQKMSAGSTASGLLELRALDAGDARLRCYLSPSRSTWLPYPIRSYEPSPVLGRWLYPQPRQQISGKYVVGREWAFVTIGAPPIAGLTEGDTLSGNYGVLYEITLQLINPSAQAAPVEIGVEPGGGPARATLLVDGRQAEAALLRQDAEVRIARYVLSPGEVRAVHIQTTPQAGSNYPVRLFARTI